MATKWEQLEPSGWGTSSFGNPSTSPLAIRIHQHGFGDPSTKWTEYQEDRE